MDFPLFKTLRRLERGLPRKLVPERDIHRLDMFIERLGSSSPSDRTMIWSVNLEALEVISISLSADGTRYEGVHRLG